MNKALRRAQEWCRSDVMPRPGPDNGQLYCNATWDGWGCWNHTSAGSRAYQQCPTYLSGFDPSLRAYKDCGTDGRWWRSPHNNSWSNYTACVNLDDLRKDTRLVHIFLSGYSISIAFLVVSLAAFTCLRQLHCHRITIHKNLFLSYILNGIAWILYYSLAALDAEVLVRNPIWCRMIHVTTQYFVACNFFWMFCEGLYLHTVVVVAFTTGKRLLVACYLIGWGLPLVPTVIYTTIRWKSQLEAQRCWLDESDLQWIVFGPIVFTIVVNFVFLCNIVRVLVTKLRAVDTPNANQARSAKFDYILKAGQILIIEDPDQRWRFLHTTRPLTSAGRSGRKLLRTNYWPLISRKAVRATLILIPLLGLQYTIFPLRPQSGSPLEEAYLVISAVVTSFQGLFVALIFCLFNGEVTSLIKRKWKQHRLMRAHSWGRAAGPSQSVTVAADSPTAKVQPKADRACLDCSSRRKRAAIFKLFSLNVKHRTYGESAASPAAAAADTGRSFL